MLFWQNCYILSRNYTVYKIYVNLLEQWSSISSCLHCVNRYIHSVLRKISLSLVEKDIYDHCVVYIYIMVTMYLYDYYTYEIYWNISLIYNIYGKMLEGHLYV